MSLIRLPFYCFISTKHVCEFDAFSDKDNYQQKITDLNFYDTQTKIYQDQCNAAQLKENH